jgi:hypothetical protein
MTALIFIAIVYGISKAVCDIKRDREEDNRIYSWAIGSAQRMSWYVGGRANGYENRPPLTKLDCWHTFDNLRLGCVIAAFLVPELTLLEKIVGIVLVWWIAGRVFALFYHTVLPTKPDQKFGVWVVNTFLFWRGENK